MYRSTIAAACALGLCVSSAHADFERFEVAIKYDTMLLTTELGLAEVQKSIRSQARDVCSIETSLSLISAAGSVDRKCMSMVVKDATSGIEAKEGVDFATLTPAPAADMQVSRLE